MRDSILFWNAVALEADRVAHSDPARREQNGPTLASRALAIVHLAMYDAYARVVNNPANFPIYNDGFSPVNPPGGSARDAVAGAAFATLSTLYKTQVDFFQTQLNAFDVTNASYQFGMEIGEAMLELRENDPDARDCGYMFSTERFRHRVDPDNPGQGFYSPYYGAQSNGFAVRERHKLDRPPLPDESSTNDEYLTALRQVRAKGIKPELMATLPSAPNDLFNERRTAEETAIGIYWAYDGANLLGTPVRLYNRIVRVLAMHKSNTEGENARLFAFVNAAMGDAGIFAWEQKYCHDLWRPVVGIREHDKSFGPSSMNNSNVVNTINDDADPFWLPLGAPLTNQNGKNFTPNFPAYPSGHATFGAAAFHITRLFYGVPVGNRKSDDLLNGLTFVSEELNGLSRDNQGTVRPRHVRNFGRVSGNDAKSGLWGMIIENAISRVFLGVHWSFDAFALKNNGDPDLSRNIGGVRLGLDIAEDIWNFGNEKAPKLSPANATIPVPPRDSPMPKFPQQPASVNGCANNRDMGKSSGGEKKMITDVFPSGISPR
jgi:vanadium chloroperoxidase